MIDLTQVLTFSEAAEKWGLANGNTLRKAVERKKFQDDEIRKSGDVWLTTYQAMERVYGQPRKSETVIAMEDLSKLISDSVYQQESHPELEKILTNIQQAIHQQQTVTIITSHHQPESIVRVIKSQDDFHDFQKTLNRYFQSVSIEI